MCKTCGCNATGKPIQYKCECGPDCGCGMVEFDADPETVPYCCGVPMKRVK